METLNVSKSGQNNGPITVSVPVKKETLDATTVDHLATINSIATGQPHDQITKFYSNDMKTVLEQPLRERIAAHTQETLNSAIEQNRLNNVDAAKTIADLYTLSENSRVMSKYLDAGTMDMLTSGDTVSRRFAIEKLSRIALVEDIIQAKVKEAKDRTPYIGRTLDYVDAFVSGLVPGASYLDAQNNKEYADRIQALVNSNMPLEDMRAEVTQIVSDAADAGFFTQDNMNFLSDFMDVVEAGSDSYASDAQVAFGVIDVLGSIPIGTVAKVAKNPAKAATSAVRTTRQFGQTSKAFFKDAGNLAAIAGKTPEELAPAVERAVFLDDVTSVYQPTKHVSPSYSTTYTQRPTFMSPATKMAARAWEVNSRALLLARRALLKAGSPFTPETVEKIKTELRTRALATKTPRHIDTDVHFTEGLGDSVVQVDIFGTQKGQAFKGASGKKAAENLAEKLGAGYEARPYNLPNEWVVTRETNVPISFRSKDGKDSAANFDFEVWAETDVNQLSHGVLVGNFMSANAQTTKRLSSSLNLAEAAFENVKHSIERQIGSLNIKGKQLKEMAAVEGKISMGELDDSRALTVEEFSDEFYKLHNKEPTEAQVKAYALYRDLRDVEALTKADIRFKELAGEGAIVYGDGAIVVPVKKESITGQVYSEADGKFIDITDVPDGQPIFKNRMPLDFELPMNALYVTSSTPATRRLTHFDLLQYKAGSSRIFANNEANFFVKQGREIESGGGHVTKSSPISVMAARLQGEADAAVKQLNKIVDAISEAVGKKAIPRRPSEMAKLVRGLKNTKALDDLIKANSGWNPDYHDLNSFLDWAEEANVHVGRPFSRATKDKPILSEDADIWGAFSSDTMEDTLWRGRVKTRSRKENRLRGYGGRELDYIPPLQSMERTIMQAMAYQTERAYIAQAGNGFLKAAVKNGVLENPKEIAGMSLRQKIANAVIDTKVLEGKKLELERQKILNRFSHQNPIAKGWNRVMQSTADFLYAKNVSVFGKKMYQWADAWSKDPVTALRGFTFHKTLGMFNIEQLWVQAMGTLDVAAISPKFGIQGMGLYPVVRFALDNGHENVIKHFGKTIEGLTGMNQDQFYNMVSWFNQYMRDTVVSHADFGTNPSFLERGVLHNVLKAGRKPFDEGNLINYITANNTAFLEFYSKFGPKADPFSEEASRFILDRIQALTHGMTNVSKTSFEALPFAQFTSYVFRINEALFAGSFGIPGKSRLTGAEKFRLGASHLALWGTGGWSIFGVASTAADWYFGEPVTKDMYELTRRGLIDHALSLMLGTETDLTNRLGAGTGLFGLFMDLQSKGAYEFALGPAGQTGKTGLELISELSNNVVHGDATLVGDSLIKFARQIKVADTAYNVAYAINYGKFVSKQNAITMDEVTTTETILKAIGIPIYDETEIRRGIEALTNNKNMVEYSTKKAQELTNLMAEAYSRGDIEQAREYSVFIGNFLNSLPEHVKLQVERKVRDSETMERSVLNSVQKLKEN